MTDSNTNNATDLRHGGCLCGAVRYTVKGQPLLVATCHCKNCQKQAGTAFSVIAFLKQDQLSVTGDLTTYEDAGESGGKVYRKFCGKCGSPLISETPGAAAEGNLFIKAGTLDDSSNLTPTLHFWTKSAQPWFALPEGGQCLETQ